MMLEEHQEDGFASSVIADIIIISTTHQHCYHMLR
jgi:hypothetical protein